MAYIDPETVVSPKNRIRSLEVLYSGGDRGWSVARLEYDGREALGIRWNGASDEQGIGNPQSRARPTWFVIPQELENAILQEVDKLEDSRHADLISGYREMAADQQREAEATEWCEGLIGDANNPER